MTKRSKMTPAQRIKSRLADSGLYPELVSEYVSVPHAANLAGVTRNTIYNWLANGKLKSERIAGRLVVVKSSLGAASPDLRNGQ